MISLGFFFPAIIASLYTFPFVHLHGTSFGPGDPVAWWGLDLEFKDSDDQANIYCIYYLKKGTFFS